jgi:TetR/AcrR family transcriptional regulator, transcriptional repressor for nem operon
MSKGDTTKQRIVAQDAEVFNTRGFFGTSMGDLTRATGLEKGGIYNHFPSKEALALAAFEHAVGLMGHRFAEAMSKEQHAIRRLEAMISIFAETAERPPVRGGCPVLNTAIEADDTSPTFLERAREAMTSWHRLIGKTIKEGKHAGEIRADCDPYEVATIITAMAEGAIMLSKLYDDRIYMERAAAHLILYVRSFEF